MSSHSYAVSNLEGYELVGIDVEEGCVYFVVLDPKSETEFEYAIQPLYPECPHHIVDIEGDMADLIDSPILEARYDSYMMRYIVTSALGVVAFSANGPDTEFTAC